MCFSGRPLSSAIHRIPFIFTSTVRGAGPDLYTVRVGSQMNAWRNTDPRGMVFNDVGSPSPRAASCDAHGVDATSFRRPAFLIVSPPVHE